MVVVVVEAWSVMSMLMQAKEWREREREEERGRKRGSNKCA